MSGTGLAWRPKSPTNEYYYDNDGDDDVLVIGIDFGTTFSGVAWATKTEFEKQQVNIITSWPGTGREEGKAPTEICYENDQELPSWGYDIQAEEDPVRWFKLLLLKSEDLPQDIRDSEYLIRGRKMIKEAGKTAVDSIADYLRALWRHVIDIVSKARGDAVIDAMTFHVVITVPAIWKGYARQGMEQAARKAGILDFRPAGETRLTFAPEPEAAALSTLCDQGGGVTKGDVYIICDAGGGTVDLISYEVTQTSPSISLKEAVEGTGGLCGGVFIDEAFELICKTRLGSRWNRLSKASIKKIMKDEWESGIKPQFDPSNNRRYNVTLPADAFKSGSSSSLDDLSKEPYIKNGTIHFQGSHVQKAFSAVFSDIDKLVDEQIDKVTKRGLSVTGIILVGGLGGSPYLYGNLKNRHSNAGIVILQSGGMKPRTAICRGAVFKGFLDGISSTDVGAPGSGHLVDAPIAVTSTIARISVGIKYRTEFKEYKHLQKDKEWDRYEGIYKAVNQMSWYLKKGDNVSKTMPVSHSWHHTFKRESTYDGTLLLGLYQCDDSDPPSRQEPSVSFLCTVGCELDIRYEDMPDFKTKTDETFKKLSYELEMVPSGAALEFVVYVNGRKQQGQNTTVRYQ